MSEAYGIFTPVDHDEYLTKYWRHTQRQEKMSRAQHEAAFFRRRSWRKHPEWDIHESATFLAGVGELSGPESRLGATREEALRFLRRRLRKVLMVELEETLEDYDLSAPHPVWEFGPGWTAEDQRLSRARSRAAEEREGHQSLHAFVAKRHSHWYYRLIDSLPSLERVTYAISVPRRWRWIRYAI